MFMDLPTPLKFKEGENVPHASQLEEYNKFSDPAVPDLPALQQLCQVEGESK